MTDRDLQSGFELGQWTVRPSLGRIGAGEVEHHVEPKVMSVLVCLAQRAGDMVSRDELVDEVWEGRPVSDDGLSRCITELRKVLGDDARNPVFIETVPKRGYRLLQRVAPLQPKSTQQSAAAWRTRAFGAAFALVLLVGLGYWLTRSEPADPDPAPTAASERHRLAVLPLVTRSPDPDDSFLADGLHDDLLTRLSRVGAWDVISRTSVERFRGTDEVIPDIAAQLDATLVLEGGVQRSGEEVRINVQLIDSRDDTHVWAMTYNRALTVESLFDVQSEIVNSIVDEVSVALGAVPEPAAGAPTGSFAAYNEYVKGRRQVRTESVTSLNAAIEHFSAAVRIDPNYAEARAALADAYLSLAAYFYGGITPEEAIALAEPEIVRSLELRPDIAQAHVANALLNMLQSDGVAAEEAIATALDIQPSYQRAYRVFATLRWRQQRREEAIELAEHAAALDPLSGVTQLELGRYYEAVARYDEALDNYLIASNVLPQNAVAPINIGVLKYLVFGDVAGSLRWYEKAAELDPESPSMVAAAALPYLEIGNIERAEHFVERGLALGADVFWSRFASLLLALRREDADASISEAEKMLAVWPNQWTGMRVLRDRDLAAGNPDLALARYAAAHAELVEPEEPRVDERNYKSAVDLALVYAELGEQEKARKLTAAALSQTEGLHRNGTAGFWLTDVSAHTIRGDYDLALDRLEEAIDDGYRMRLWYYLDIDRNLAPLRDLPRFRALRDRVRELIEIEAGKAAALADVA